MDFLKNKSLRTKILILFNIYNLIFILSNSNFKKHGENFKYVAKKKSEQLMIATYAVLIIVFNS